MAATDIGITPAQADALRGLAQFYDRFFRPGAYLPTHADHQRVWHQG